MSDQRMGTCTVCLTGATLPYGCRERAPPPAAAGSVASELAVGGPVRTRRLGTQPLDLVLFVVGEVALEPEPLGVALVGEDVRRHAVEEPPVVADHHGAAVEP